MSLRPGGDKAKHAQCLRQGWVPRYPQSKTFGVTGEAKRMNRSPNRVTLELAGLALAALLGMALGLTRCGGPTWVPGAALVTMVVITAAVWRQPINVARPALSRAATTVAIALVFVVTEIVSAAAYPRLPDSFADYVEEVARVLELGAC